MVHISPGTFLYFSLINKDKDKHDNYTIIKQLLLILITKIDNRMCSPFVMTTAL